MVIYLWNIVTKIDQQHMQVLTSPNDCKLLHRSVRRDSMYYLTIWSVDFRLLILGNLKKAWAPTQVRRCAPHLHPFHRTNQDFSLAAQVAIRILIVVSIQMFIMSIFMLQAPCLSSSSSHRVLGRGASGLLFFLVHLCSMGGGLSDVRSL